MSITLPRKLEHFRHDDIVHLIKELNSQYDLPHRGSWGEGIPDLEEPITRQVVEVAIARDLKTVWGQCVYYYRMGASRIHLVLSPRLFQNYRRNECIFVKENPIPNIEVYTLPNNRFPIILPNGRPPIYHKTKINDTNSNASKHVAIWPFLASKSENAKPKIKQLMEKDVDTQTVDDADVTDDADDTLIIESSLFSDDKAEVHCEGKKHLCIACQMGALKDEAISCKQYGWIIQKELASRQRLCAF